MPFLQHDFITKKDDAGAGVPMLLGSDDRVDEKPVTVVLGQGFDLYVLMGTVDGGGWFPGVEPDNLAPSPVFENRGRTSRGVSS